MRIASSRYQDAITKNNSKRRSLIKPYLPLISFMETAGNHHTLYDKNLQPILVFL